MLDTALHFLVDRCTRAIESPYENESQDRETTVGKGGGITVGFMDVVDDGGDAGSGKDSVGGDWGMGLGGGLGWRDEKRNKKRIGGGRADRRLERGRIGFVCGLLSLCQCERSTSRRTVPASLGRASLWSIQSRFRGDAQVRGALDRAILRPLIYHRTRNLLHEGPK